MDCLFVPACPVCRCPETQPLCKECRKKLETLYAPWPVVRNEMHFDTAYSAFAYSHPEVRSLVFCLKIQGTEHAVRVAGAALESIVVQSVVLSGVDVITWVPRSRKNVAEWGFDQSYLLAGELSRRTGIPCRDLLARRKETQTQHKLSRQERAVNLKDCFVCREKVFGGEVLLIDDVITSGASLNEASKALKKGGYDFVRGLSLASTDKRPEK